MGAGRRYIGAQGKKGRAVQFGSVELAGLTYTGVTHVFDTWGNPTLA